MESVEGVRVLAAFQNNFHFVFARITAEPTLNIQALVPVPNNSAIRHGLEDRSQHLKQYWQHTKR